MNSALEHTEHTAPPYAVRPHQDDPHIDAFDIIGTTGHIIGFIKPEEIPTTYFDASYFAAPNGPAAERSYALLREVMKRSGRIGIAKVILREREDLITISPNGDGLMIQKLHYRHEVRSVSDVPGISSQATPQDNELQLATTLVEQMVTTFDQIDTTDHFHAALKEMLDAKVAGETIRNHRPSTKAGSGDRHYVRTASQSEGASEPGGRNNYFLANTRRARKQHT